MQNLKPLASLYSCAGQFESYPVKNPEVRFSSDVAQIIGTDLYMKIESFNFRKHLM